ncbi:hypothetical protein DKM28_01245 [Methanosarcina mazei]|jgi:hypothetical protein|uniref:Uncharacterized protein n=7 Tax=Methanosarcina mazei TaxID=2209 RepID=A0A4P8QYB4_METMZ|nr:hypothetical protein [Methanosarcina mazei]QCR14860.1 hypothetical protein DKM28_01245 [Methanosarcina mazei]QIB90622.1 hypothetical protein FQU78_05665 [Methanosarcina mazei]TAH75465.1 MAG: hypothetical protein EWM52_01690 [Methanosarcina mazei]
MGYFWGICLSDSTENLHRVKIALQLSFILWVMLGILILYATFEEQSRLFVTFLLLCSVIFFTPFLPEGTDLPEGTGYKEIENLEGYREE